MQNTLAEPLTGTTGTLNRMESLDESAAVPVLVVEDELPLAQIVTDYLAKAGYEAVQVHSGP
jgi:hypothetical protein